MAITELQRQYLDAMGIQVWVQRHSDVPVVTAESVALMTQVPTLPATTESVHQYPDNIHSNEPLEKQWQRLAYEISQCQACDQLCQQRTQTVFGVGNQQADWMIIGEAPGVDEDRQGEPFVGQAGKLLDEMLLAIGLNRDQVFIANILKCHPPKNRDPRSEEVSNCQDYLRRQIALVQPRIIIAVGGIAAQNLLQTDMPVGKLRGKKHDYQCRQAGDAPIPLVVTYHPAYLLRSPAEKGRVWQDLQLARRIMAERLTDPVA